MKSYVILCLVAYHRSMRSSKCSDRALAYDALWWKQLYRRENKWTNRNRRCAQHANTTPQRKHFDSIIIAFIFLMHLSSCVKCMLTNFSCIIYARKILLHLVTMLSTLIWNNQLSRIIRQSSNIETEREKNPNQITFPMIRLGKRGNFQSAGFCVHTWTPANYNLAWNLTGIWLLLNDTLNTQLCALSS